MLDANKTTDSNEVVNNITVNINISINNSGDVICGDNNIVVDESSNADKSIGEKSVLVELLGKIGKFIAKIVSKIKAMFSLRK